MDTSAIVMAIFGAVVLFGGTAYFISIAMKGKGF
ncbi:MAG: MetS family NSS transporter small subunit [Firmicutes bacterium]|nr:MetS family NSS transporter small subunit [Bacillota bacterium]